MISTDNKSYIHEAFAKQVEQNPDIEALQIYYHKNGKKALTPPTGHSLSYRELDLKAAELARGLIEQEQPNGTVTAVLLDNPLDIVTAVMAVLKAGGIYVLINPNDPREYNNYILEHSRAKAVITQNPADESDNGPLKLIKSFCGCPRGCVSRFLEKSPLAAGGKNNSTAGGNKEVGQPAFLCYSLHLTGKSEAIVLRLQDICNWIKFNIEKLKIDFSRTFYVVSGRWEMNFPIWLANLVCGGKIYFYPLCGDHWDRDMAGLSQIMAENKFKSFVCTLAFLEELNSREAYGDVLHPGLSNIVSAGETSFDAHQLKAFLKERKIRWHNYYGFPDIKMVTTLAEEPGTAVKGNRFKHVGRPVSSSRAYILDSAQKPVSIGVSGDLYVSGHAAPHCYFQNDLLNRTHFLDNPFLTQTTMFKYCHQAHWLPDGKICLSPRPGEMTVINGRRITLTGIESPLLENPLVDDCAVITKIIAGSPPGLTAFILPAKGAGKIEEIGDLLNKYLEDYLYKEILPLGFVVFSSLPRTPEGLVDRESLGELELLDSIQIKRLEQEIKKDPRIESVAVIAEEKIDPPLPLHIKDFLPRQPGTEEPGETRETTKPRATNIDLSTQTPPAAHPEAETGAKPLALVHGGDLKIETQDPQTLVQILERAAEKHSDNGIIYIQPDGTDYFQTYSSLLETAERVLAGLKKLGLQPGDKAILQLGAIKDFAAAFWGCTLGGIVPVPYSVSRILNREHSEIRTLDKIRQILDNPLIISDESFSALPASLFNHLKVAELWELQAASYCKDHYKGNPEDLALLLFTSGSTGIPKGVQLCHRSILAREKAAIRFCDLTARDISCNWLPLEHVVGLLMFHIKQVYLGCNQVQARKDYILSDPLRWVDIMSKYKVTLTFAPNFATSLLNSKFKQTLSFLSTPGWDLSSLKIVNVGAEPINANTMKEFLKLFSPYGLSKNAVHPSWGMSETGSGVVYSKKFSLDTDKGIHVLEQPPSGEFIRHGAPAKEKSQIPRTTDQLTFVEVGQPFAGVSLRIVDADNRVCAEGIVGHLQVKGATLFSGYYRNPEKNKEVFSDNGWFATGDLGFIRNGCLTITGRDKDVIIINGINYNNNEIEAAVEELENIEISFTAACAVRGNTGITDKLAVFYCSLLEDFDSIIPQVKEIKKTITAKIGIRADYIIPVAKEDIPKTSIGKIQRSRLVKRFETGYFDDILRKTDIALKNENTVPAWFFKREWSKKAALPNKRSITADNCLIIQDNQDLGEKLAKRLENYGTRCIRVKLAAQFKKKDPCHYEIDDKDPGDYNRLLQAIHNDQVEIKDVFHLAGYANIKQEPGRIGSHSEAVKHSHWFEAVGLLSLIQAVDNTIRPSSMRIFVVSSHMQPAAANDEIIYEKCGIPGLLKCAAQEIPWLQCRHLDLEVTAAEAHNLDALLTEWQNPGSDAEVAYRNNSRLVPYLSHINMKQEAAGLLPLKKQGLYLVTGGLGGIGIHLCKWLMEKFQAKLIIIGRTVLPHRDKWKTKISPGRKNSEENNKENSEEHTVISQRMRAYLEIEASGGDFIYESGDISDELFLKQIMEKAKAQWGQSLSGIFHLAGISSPKNNGQSPEDQMVLFESGSIFNTLERMSRAKVYGTLNLHRLIEDNSNTLFVAFSSVISLFGAVAYGAYAAVNSFLDGFCHYRRHSGYPNTYCLNWSSWKDIGMSAGNPPGAEETMQRSGYEFINPGQGLNSLLMVLQCHPGQYVIGIDSTNKNLRAFLQRYPLGKQVLKVYYTGKDGKDYTVKDLHPLAANIFPTGNNKTNVVMEAHPVDSIPVKQGAIDYTRLTARDKNRRGSILEFDLPRTSLEKTLVQLWQEVLGNVRIGIDDHFFELGGHSLQAIMLTAKIHKEFDIKVSLKDIFQAPTIREFSRYIQGLEAAAYFAVEPVEKKEYYPLSSAQKRFYVVQQMDTNSIAYNLALTVELEGHIETERMENTFKELIKRHESLRTSFEIINEEPVQRIQHYHEVDFAIELAARSSQPAAEIIGSFIRPFDLSRAPLLRVRLMEVEKEKHILMIDTHHIMMDNISGSILIRDTKTLYRGEQLPKLRLRYKDYSHWKEKQDEKNIDALKNQEEYWHREFNGEIPVLNLPLDFDRPTVKTFAGAKFNFALDKKQSRRLMEIARQENATLFMVLLAVYVVLLYKLSRQPDIIVGIPIAGRDHNDLQEILGVFLNMLAIKTSPSSGKTFEVFLKEVKEKTLNAFENQEYPFEELVDKVMVKKTTSRNPLFDVGFDLKNTIGEKHSPTGTGKGSSNVKIKPYEHEYGSARLDIGFFGRTAGEQISFVLEYSTELFKKTTIERFVNYFKEIVSIVIENKGVQLKHISISHDLAAAKLKVLQEDRGDFAF